MNVPLADKDINREKLNLYVCVGKTKHNRYPNGMKRFLLSIATKGYDS